MRIYLVRHGDAVGEDEAGSDRDRWLTARGRELARTLGQLLAAEAVVPDAIVCSPLPRAVQTAELVALGLDHVAPIASLRCLEPSGDPRVAVRAAAAAGHAVIVVSHEPLVSTLAAVVASVPAFSPFRTAQCCAFDGGRPLFTARADLAQVLRA